MLLEMKFRVMNILGGDVHGNRAKVINLVLIFVTDIVQLYLRDFAGSDVRNKYR